VREELQDLGVIKVGAEAVLRKVSWRGLILVEKMRVGKPYRHPQLDSEIRRTRTMKEARIMVRAKELGVTCPTIIHVDLERTAIYMQYIGGVDLRELLASGDPRIPRISEILGSLLAALHTGGIFHGDFVPSNILVLDDYPVIIDFGLSGYSHDVEEYAVDLHLFDRGIKASHPSIATSIVEKLMRGYEKVAGRDGLREVLEKIAEIRSRARYVVRETRLHR